MPTKIFFLARNIEKLLSTKQLLSLKIQYSIWEGKIFWSNKSSLQRNFNSRWASSTRNSSRVSTNRLHICGLKASDSGTWWEWDEVVGCLPAKETSRWLHLANKRWRSQTWNKRGPPGSGLKPFRINRILRGLPWLQLLIITYNNSWSAISQLLLITFMFVLYLLCWSMGMLFRCCLAFSWLSVLGNWFCFLAFLLFLCFSVLIFLINLLLLLFLSHLLFMYLSFFTIFLLSSPLFLLLLLGSFQFILFLDFLSFLLLLSLFLFFIFLLFLIFLLLFFLLLFLFLLFLLLLFFPFNLFVLFRLLFFLLLLFIFFF